MNGCRKGFVAGYGIGLGIPLTLTPYGKGAVLSTCAPGGRER